MGGGGGLGRVTEIKEVSFLRLAGKSIGTHCLEKEESIFKGIQSVARSQRIYLQNFPPREDWWLSDPRQTSVQAGRHPGVCSAFQGTQGTLFLASRGCRCQD